MKSLILALCLAFNFTVFAQEGGQQKGHACIPDLKKFCKSLEKGRGRMLKCLSEHKKELSPACAAKIDAKVAKMGKNGGGKPGMGKGKGLRGEGKGMGMPKTDKPVTAPAAPVAPAAKK